MEGVSNISKQYNLIRLNLFFEAWEPAANLEIAASALNKFR